MPIIFHIWIFQPLHGFLFTPNLLGKVLSPPFLFLVICLKKFIFLLTDPTQKVEGKAASVLKTLENPIGTLRAQTPSTRHDAGIKSQDLGALKRQEDSDTDALGGVRLFDLLLPWVS